MIVIGRYQRGKLGKKEFVSLTKQAPALMDLLFSQIDCATIEDLLKEHGK